MPAAGIATRSRWWLRTEPPAGSGNPGKGIMKPPTCPYCRAKSQLVNGSKIYNSNQFNGQLFYACLPCQAWVGCHKGTDKPLGRLANKELRQAKVKAHAAFDPIWRSSGNRRGGYAWLAEQLGIEAKDCHIGMFDVPMCERVVEICLGREA